MSWSIEQFLDYVKRSKEAALVNIKKQQDQAQAEPVAAIPEIPTANVDNRGVYFFTVPGEPRGKPRMTQRDVWKKRPRVVRYREYADNIRAAAGTLPPGDPLSILVVAWLPMPESWSLKKKQALNGHPARSKPDWDNIGKAVCDALLKEDKLLGGGTCWKFWCFRGSEQTDITVLYPREQSIG
jgi:Holliday junction resolvase RusA-like endonuclease